MNAEGYGQKGKRNEVGRQSRLRQAPGSRGQRAADRRQRLGAGSAKVWTGAFELE